MTFLPCDQLCDSVTGTFSLPHAAASLVWAVVGGIGVGLVIGRVIRFVRFRLDNPPLEVMIAFLTGYFTFLPASAIGASGVLAVVTAGVYMGWHTPELTTVDTRLQGSGFWAIFNFLLDREPEWVSAVGARVLGNCRADVGFIAVGYPDGCLGACLNGGGASNGSRGTIARQSGGATLIAS